jgi:penicillin-binding protein 1A
VQIKKANPDSEYSCEFCQIPKVTGAILVMDPVTGEILAMSGGYSFDVSSFNCATQAQRQPGSAVKPFVYAAALESGLNEFDIIEDKPISIQMSDGQTYTPQNYSKKAYGKMPMRNGLIYSRNLATFNLASMVGFRRVMKMLRKAGLVGEKRHISGILGSIETTLLNIVAAYSCIVNDGLLVSPRFIKSITRQSNQEVPEKIEKLMRFKKKKRIMSAETAQTIKNMLRDTAKYGTASALCKCFDEYRVDLGGKTGTTNDFRDGWFIGYITKNGKTLLVGAFVGYPKQASLGDHESGTKVALPIFYNFLRKFCKK